MKKLNLILLVLFTSLVLVSGSFADGITINQRGAKKGVNDDITEITGLTTPLTVGQGGTGVSTSGTTGQIPVGGGASSAIVWTTATGTGAPVRAGSPTFTTQITTPKITDAGDITIESTGAGVNVNIDNTADDDFVVDTDKLVVEGDTGDMGIGIAEPTFRLHVVDPGNMQAAFVTTNGSSRLFLDAQDSAGEFSEIHFRSGGGAEAKIYGNNSSILTFDTAGSDRMTISAAGVVDVVGELTAGTKTFVIDHPIDASKKLYHAVFEGPEHGLIYRGKTKLVMGKAKINIDEYFGMIPGTFKALAQDVIVQSLQNQDGFDRVKPGSVTENGFEIISKNSASTDEIAWMVTAARKDDFVKKSPLNDSDGHLILEVDKN